MRHCDRPSSGSRCGRPRKTLRTAALGPAITLPNTPAVCVSGAQLPLTLDMADFNSGGKHAELPIALPLNANRPGRIHNGDLMLYGTNTPVVFYLTFDSSYTYTRLGRMKTLLVWHRRLARVRRASTFPRSDSFFY